ncbi:MAG TPA: cation-transporting P-type ATPase [Vicinamibacterales bacterium]
MPNRFAHACSEETLLQSLTSSPSGLSSAAAEERLRADGPNRLNPPRHVSPLRVLADQLRSMVMILLIAAAAISFAVGDHVEAWAIGAVLVINATIGFTTEWRARRAIAALLDLDVLQAVALRDGQLVQVPAEQLVVGDVIEVNGGQQVPADGRVLTASNAQVDEAALTGESLPVAKQPGTLPESTALADRVNMMHKGTTMMAGTARVVVTATGMTTEVGNIDRLVESVRPERTPLERRLDALGHRLAWLALSAAGLVSLLAYRQQMPLPLIFETGLALAVAAVPEALPAVATIALAVGVHRMSRRRVLIRRLPVVESLGSTTVVCTDKTRTLTSGEMTVVRIWDGRDHEVAAMTLAPPARRAIEAAVLASRPHANGGGNPVDHAMMECARRFSISPDGLAQSRPLVAELTFSSERKYQASFRQTRDGLSAYLKGAPRTILELCAFGPAGEPIDVRQMDQVNDRLAADGLRVLALASGPVAAVDAKSLRGLTLLGFVGLMDPPAPGVKETIARLRAAGLRTVMITGDQRLTARAVGHELGLLDADSGILDGRDLLALPEAELASLAATIGAYTRVTPADKLAIVAALQARGEIVAMLGDGVNDAPALRRANVGVSMGIRGTDIAKQSAGIILQDDRFESIAGAVEEGRVVFDNIRKFVFYLFSCNTAEILVLVIAGVAAWPLPVLPLQLLWINIITDTFPALALSMEPGDAGVMRRPPRDPREAILSPRFLLGIAGYAALITASTLGVFLWVHGSEPARASTAAFMTLSFAQSLHLVNARSTYRITGAAHGSNPYAIGGVALAIGLQLMAAFVPPLAHALHVVPLRGEDWMIVAAASMVPAMVGQLVKRGGPMEGGPP